MENWAYRQLKALTPGPYTFVLRATHQLPKRLQDPKKRSIGIRVPDHTIAADTARRSRRAAHELDAAAADRSFAAADPEEIRDRLERHVDAIIDGGACGIEPTSVLDLSGGDVAVVRRGKGDVSAFGG